MNSFSLFLKRNRNVIIGVVIVILVILFFSNRGQDNEEGVTKRNQANDTAETVVQAMTPYAADGYEYSFTTIDWEMTEADPVRTYVAMRLADFSRQTNRSPVFLARPFGIGEYDGVCTPALATEANISDQVLVGALSCSGGTDVLVTQGSENPALISLYNYVDGSVEFLRSIDMAQIVKS